MRASSAGSLNTGDDPEAAPKSTVAVAPDARAMNSAVRRIRMWTSSRIALSNVRTVPVITTLSGMMLPRTPPLIVATVTTAGASVMSVWRAVIVCSAVMISAETTTGSTPFHGWAPCVCLPFTMIVRPSAIDIAAPGLKLSLPGSSGHTCSPKIADGAGFSSAPSSIMTCAPPCSPGGGPSSAGWKMNFTVPGICARIPASTVAAPMSIAVCASWPHACITPTSCPANVDRTLDLNGRSTCSVTGSASMSARSATTPPGFPPRSTPTTPVFATPSRTSSPSDRR